MSLSIQTAEFFDTRLLALTKLVKQSFVRLISDTPSEQILGLGLVTDASARQVIPTIYRRHDHDHSLDVARKRYEDTGVNWDLYLRWSPVEWPRSTATAPTAAVPALDESWQELLDRRGRSSGVDRTYWPSVMFEMAANALVVLHRDGWFDEYPHSVQVLQVIEGTIDRVTARRWATNMNTAAALQSYLSHEQQFISTSQ